MTSAWKRLLVLRALSVALLCLASPLQAHAAEVIARPLQEPGWNFTSLHGGPIFARQGGGNSLSALVRYAPSYTFEDAERFSVGPNLGFSVLRNDGSSAFAVIEYAVHGTVRISEHISARLLLGGQTWTGGNGTAFFVGAEAFYHFGPNEWGESRFLDSVFIAYAPVFQGALAQEFSLGVGVQF